MTKLDTSKGSIFKQMEAFAIERHSIYLRRAAGQQFPWTKDPILQKYKFCNIFRELDRTTVWIRENVREPFADNENLWFMIILARFFNRPECIADVIEHAWPSDKKWSSKRTLSLLKKRTRTGQLCWNPAAYNIYTPRVVGTNMSEHICTKVFPVLWKDQNRISTFFESKPSCNEAWELFQLYPSFGTFMSAQIVYDLMHTKYLEDADDTDTWAGCGPGSVRGLNRVLGRDTNYRVNQREIDHDSLISEMSQIRRFIKWPNKWPKLSMCDIENVLCEFDKYQRIKETGKCSKPYVEHRL